MSKLKDPRNVLVQIELPLEITEFFDDNRMSLERALRIQSVYIKFAAFKNRVRFTPSE